MVSLTSVLPDDNADKAKQQDGAASIFSDDRGNLRFVNLVVRRPIFVFVCTLSTCMLLTAVLLRVVFANGNPITDDQAMYDVNDPRSIAWDSIRLARREIDSQFSNAASAAASARSSSGGSSSSGGGDSEIRQQELPGDFTYWVFEAKTDAGVFGTREGLSVLKEAEDIFFDHPSFPDNCKLVYHDDTGDAACERPLSATNSYYASTWNSTTVQRVIAELGSSDTSKIDLYNSIGPCIEFGIGCQHALPAISDSDLQWAQSLNHDMNAIVSTWDGEGDLNANITEVAMPPSTRLQPDLPWWHFSMTKISRCSIQSACTPAPS